MTNRCKQRVLEFPQPQSTQSASRDFAGGRNVIRSAAPKMERSTEERTGYHQSSAFQNVERRVADLVLRLFVRSGSNRDHCNGARRLAAFELKTTRGARYRS
jgi:hypothetical protein